MKTDKLLSLTLLMFYSSLVCAQGRQVLWNRVDLSGEFRIEPNLATCRQHTEPCSEAPTYNGTVRILATTSDDGRLTNFQILVNDVSLDLDMVDRYGDIPDFGLGNFYLTYPTVYLPKAAREGVVGFSTPLLQVNGLSVLDDSCAWQIRQINIVYRFESGEADVRDECFSP